MDAEIRAQGERAIERLEAAIAAGPHLAHADVRRGMVELVAFRDAAAAAEARGGLDRATLESANALVSLAYGALFPLAGVHVDRLEQTRDGLRALIGAGEGGSKARGGAGAER